MSQQGGVDEDKKPSGDHINLKVKGQVIFHLISDIEFDVCITVYLLVYFMNDDLQFCTCMTSELYYCHR